MSVIQPLTIIKCLYVSRSQQKWVIIIMSHPLESQFCLVTVFPRSSTVFGSLCFPIKMIFINVGNGGFCHTGYGGRLVQTCYNDPLSSLKNYANIKTHAMCQNTCKLRNSFPNLRRHAYRLLKAERSSKHNTETVKSDARSWDRSC